MIADVLDSLADIVSPAFRGALAKSLFLTLAILALAWLALDRLLTSFVTFEPAWLATAASILVGFGLVFGLAFLAAPTASIVAGFFLDEIAANVEREVDPTGPQGRPAPALESAIAALRYGPLALAVGLLGLVLLFIPGFGLAAWIAANAYLLGREYFELAAMRFRPANEARALRQANAVSVFLYGAPIALFVIVPIVNLATPLFATALMARLNKRLARASVPLPQA